jgi:hypothetical protein
MALVVIPSLETHMRILRRCLCALAIGSGLLLGACDEGVEVGGVGASVGLPTAFTSDATDSADIGVGNVHWVGNPRW